jgi:adenylate cyclase
MIKRLLTILFLIASSIAVAIDSQNMIVQHLQLANGHLKTDVKMAEEYANKALVLSDKIGYLDGSAEAYWLIGRIEFNKGHLTQSGQSFEKASQLFNKTGNQRMYAITLKDFADYQRTRGKLKEATETVSKAKLIAISSKNFTLQAECELLLGAIDIANGDFPAAIDRTLKSLRISEESTEPQGMVNAYLQLGNINSLQGNLKTSNQFFFKALELNKKAGNKLGEADANCNLGSNFLKEGNLEKAEMYIKASIKQARELNYSTTLALDLMNLGYLKLLRKEYSEGESLLSEAKAKYQTMGNEAGEAEVMNILGYLYSLQRKYGAAEETYMKASKLAERTHNYELLQAAFAGLSYLAEKRGDYKSAYDFEKKRDNWSDKIYNSTSTKLVTQKQMTYEFDKIQRELEREKNLKDEIIAEKTTRVRILAFSILAILLLSSGLVFMKVKSSRLANYNKQLLSEKNELLARDNENKERIIHEVLPSEIEEKLVSGRNESREKLVHVMFIDFDDFSKKEQLFDPYDLIEHMDQIFKVLGNVSKEYGLETMKTMLDGYLCIAGLENAKYYTGFFTAYRGWI